MAFIRIKAISYGFWILQIKTITTVAVVLMVQYIGRQTMGAKVYSQMGNSP